MKRFLTGILTLSFGVIVNAQTGSTRYQTGAGIKNGSGTFNVNSTGTVTVPNGTDTLVNLNGSQTLSNKGFSDSVSIGGNNAVTGNQTVGGTLSVSNTVFIAEETDAATTGANQTLALPKGVLRLTNVSLTSIAGVTAPASGNPLAILVNVTGAELSVINDATATAANRIITGTGANLVWKNNSSLWLAYDNTTDRWRIIGGSGAGGGSTVFGSTGSPRSVVAATGITSGASHMSTTDADQLIFIQGATATSEENVSANPQIQAHTVIGSKMRLQGASNTQTVLLEDGNGLRLKSDWRSSVGSTLDLIWDGTVWNEFGRSIY